MSVLSVELHAHSSASHDGRDPIDLLLEQARAVGLDALAITDHDRIEASVEAARRAAEYDLIGIPGIEVTTAAGHLLGLGVTDRIEAGRTFAETVDAIHDQGGIAIVPHPFQESRHGVAKHLDGDEIAIADAIEVYNSRLLVGLGNRRARRFAVDRGLPEVAGSDAHISEMVGQARTLIDADERSMGGIVEAIRAGRTRIEGRRTPWRISMLQAAGGIKRRLSRRMSSYR